MSQSAHERFKRAATAARAAAALGGAQRYIDMDGGDVAEVLDGAPFDADATPRSLRQRRPPQLEGAPETRTGVAQTHAKLRRMVRGARAASAGAPLHSVQLGGARAHARFRRQGGP